MTAKTFVQPNMTTQSGVAYRAAIDDSIAVLAETSQDFAPHQSTVANLNVLVDAGKGIKADGTLIEQSQQSIAFIAPTVNPRIDRIVIDPLTLVASRVAGTEAASPVAPAIPVGKLPCAKVSLTVGQTQITNINITDERTTFVNYDNRYLPSSAPEYAAAAGTDTYTATLSPVPAAYVTGAEYHITFTNANTSTTPTLNINSLGAKTIKKEGSAALVVGDIPAGHAGILRYNGTDLILVNPSGNRIAGALVYLSSQSIPNATVTAVNWTAESYDTVACHDNVTNNTRLTVPAGYTKARLTCAINFSANATGDREVQIYSSGSPRPLGTPYMRHAAANIVSLALSTAIMPVTAGEYFECMVSQNSGGALSVTGGTAPGGSYFSIELFN